MASFLKTVWILAVDFFFVLSGFVIGYAYDDRWKKPTPSLPSVANEGFAPLCGAAATSVAALKTPVAPVGRELFTSRSTMEAL